jgi:hypothetical protein
MGLIGYVTDWPNQKSATKGGDLNKVKHWPPSWISLHFLHGRKLFQPLSSDSWPPNKGFSVDISFPSCPQADISVFHQLEAAILIFYFRSSQTAFPKGQLHGYSFPRPLFPTVYHMLYYSKFKTKIEGLVTTWTLNFYWAFSVSSYAHPVFFISSVLFFQHFV